MAITHPPVLINGYLAEKIPQRLSGQFRGPMNFLPTMPSDINALSRTNPALANDVFCVYDRMPRLNRKAFPHIKCEQLVYYFYKMNGDPEALFETVQVVHDLLDRVDESGQEVNEWVQSKINNQGFVALGSGRLQKNFKPVFFHEFKVYSLEESRDIVSQQTNKTYVASKLIINYDYHVKDYS